MGEPLTPEEEVALRRVVAEDVAAVYRSDVAALLATLDAARAAAPAGETDTTPAGDPEMPHVPKPTDICSDCGRGLVHVIPSLDPPAPVQVAEDAANKAGHRTNDPHDCFTMRCHDLASDLEAAREAASKAVAEVLERLETTARGWWGDGMTMDYVRALIASERDR